MNNNESALSRLFSLAGQERARTILNCVLMSIGTLAGMIPYVAVFFIAKQLLTEPEATQGVRSMVIFWAVLSALGIVAAMVFSFLGSYGAHKVAFQLLYGIRIRVTEHIGRLPMGFFSGHTTGEVQKTMDASIEKIELFMAHLLPDLAASAVAVTALFIGIGMMNIGMALILLAAVIGACFLQLRVWGGNRGQDILTGLAAVSGSMTGAFGEYVKGIAEVKLFGLTGTVTRGLEAATHKYGDWEVKLYHRAGPFYEGYKTIILSLLAVVLPAGALLLYLSDRDPEVILGVLMALIITPAICNPLMELINYGTQMGEITVALHNIDTIMDIEPISAPVEGLRPEHYDVVFHHVSFSYQSTSDPFARLALDDISFTARQQQMTALVGPSGGGKTTIGQLISRFWDVTGGKITIGGIDIRDMDPAWLMDCVAFVFQDTYIFSDTVVGNITMHREYPLEQIIAAAKAAQCHEFIMALPDGYETKLGSGGISLSGGEAQRLAIARAILKDSPIVILDEALAYSDAENENQIQKAIDRLIRPEGAGAGKTVLIIAHRLPSIRYADQILVLDQGTLREQGTHETLMSEESLYRELWTIQNTVDDWSIERGNVS